MRTNHLSLAAVFFSLFLTPAFSQTIPLPTESLGEILPAPVGPGGSVGPQNFESELAYIVPKERTVTVNLSVDRPPIPRKAQFKLKRSGQVLAETSQSRPEQLEFEVMIEGPVCDLPVFLPVSSQSRINAVYAEHGETNPDLVVEELAKLGVPDVSVVAILRAHGTERHDGDGFLGVDVFDTWTPYYRVGFKDAAIPPVLVKVPRVDCELYRLTERTVANCLHYDCELPVLTISQGNLGSHPPICHCRELGYATCHCQGQPDGYPPQFAPRPYDGPAQPADGAARPYDGPAQPADGAGELLPRGPIPATPNSGDPFTDDPA